MSEKKRESRKSVEFCMRFQTARNNNMASCEMLLIDEEVKGIGKFAPVLN
jgi:hypothetical protein